MKILVTGKTMIYLSGQPLYCFELCQELKRLGHDVTMVSQWTPVGPEIVGADGHFLKEGFEKMGIKMIEWGTQLTETYDICFACEIISQSVVSQIPDTPVINIVHSEYDVEEPLPDSPQIIAYVCIRYSILEHLVKEHGIPKEKCVIIYNGVDRERFKPIKKKKRTFKKIVVPCTLDPLRESFLNKLIDEASPTKQVHIFGMNCGAVLHQNDYAFINPDKFHIEEDIADADEVAGILLGRVNLEAWSCNVPSRVYDPNTLENKLFYPPIDFDQNHNIKVVAAKLIKLAGNLDDITVVIPHHSARPNLARLLESIKNMKYVNIIKGGSFSRNCNVGVKAAVTEYVLLTNDDTTFNPSILLRQMLNSGGDITGATPDQGVRGFDIINGQLELNPQGHYPSGALMLIKKSIYDKLGGLDEIFRNGAEDIDLFMKAEKAGFTVKRIDAVYHHDESQSEGRFDKANENEVIFNRRWRGVCHIGVGNE